tara:strand:+ start:848 stop:1954 length:1107 start_codon:yes stop_codon:yes gene_type:complete
MALKEFDNYYDAIDAGYGGKAVKIGGKDVIAATSDRYLGDGKYGSTKGRDDYVSQVSAIGGDDRGTLQSQWAMSNPIAQSDYYGGSGIKSQSPKTAESGTFWDTVKPIASMALTMMNPMLGIPMMLSGQGGITSLFSDKDGDGSRWTSTKDGVTTNWLGQELNMKDGRKIGGFFDALDVDGDGSWVTTDGKFLTPQTPEQQQAYLDHARATGGGGDGNQAAPTPETFDDPNQNGWMPDGTPRCKPGYVYDASQNMCVLPDAVKDTASTTTPVSGIENIDPYTYGMSGGGEKILSAGVAGMKAGGLPRQPIGKVTGPGGPRDDLVGPIALSADEYVIPEAQVKLKGNGDYNKGIRLLDQERKQALKQYA